MQPLVKELYITQLTRCTLHKDVDKNGSILKMVIWVTGCKYTRRNSVIGVDERLSDSYILP